MTSVTDKLVTWNSIRNSYTMSRNAGILIGNGASIAVWDRFQYRSLIGTASNTMSVELQRIFEEFRTTNFEQVLSALKTALRVGRVLQTDINPAQEAYASVKDALVRAVHAVHIKRVTVPSTTLERIGAYLRHHEFVFSTNYDLLVYWALLSTGTDNLMDYFFFRKAFDIGSTRPAPGYNKVFYLHGALHLYSYPWDEVYKRTRNAGSDLLELFMDMPDEYAYPLIVTEGDSRSKLESISGSSYLSFAYRRLQYFEGPLVVFGHSLSESDQHIIDAINQHPERPLAVSVHPKENVRQTKAHYNKVLENNNIDFFDATTHPLGDPSLKVEQ